VLGVDDVVVAIVANDRRGVIGANGELPYLKLLATHARFMHLCDRDDIEKPVSAAFFGHIFRAVGVKNVAVKAVTLPVLATDKLRQVCFVESFRCHDVASFLEVTPKGGRERQRQARESSRVTGNRGINEGKPVCQDSRNSLARRLCCMVCGWVEDRGAAVVRPYSNMGRFQFAYADGVGALSVESRPGSLSFCAPDAGYSGVGMAEGSV